MTETDSVIAYFKNVTVDHAGRGQSSRWIEDLAWLCLSIGTLPIPSPINSLKTG